MTHPDARCTIAAAFAQERDAGYAIRLIASASDVEVRYTLRRVVGESGDVQMVILEAAFADPAFASRVETAMTGAHGAMVPIEAPANQASPANQVALAS